MNKLKENEIKLNIYLHVAYTKINTKNTISKLENIIKTIEVEKYIKNEFKK